MIISNNLHGKIPFADDTIVRVNTAWVKDIDALEAILQHNIKYDIFLDYPSGRTKPPKPSLVLNDLISVAEKFDNVKYFAISNAEDTEILSAIRELLIPRVEIVPKIETINGIDLIKEIILATKCTQVMLDKEDLYIDCKANSERYNEQMDKIHRKCSRYGVKILNLLGVVFG